MKKLSERWVNSLFLRFEAIYGERWSKQFQTAEQHTLSKNEWAEGCGYMLGDEIKGALDKCRNFFYWPPSIAEFRNLCKNLISQEDAFQAAIRRDFSNPVVRIAFDKIGSWEFSHSSDQDLRKKFKFAYRDAVDEVNCSESEQCDSASIDTLLSCDNSKAPLSHQLPPQMALGVSVDASESIQEAAVDGKLHFEGKSSFEWSPREYEERYKTYDKKVYRERREYLCSLSEIAATDRSRDDQIDRRRYMSEKEAWLEIQKNRREYEMRNPGGETAKNDDWKGKKWRKDIYD